MNIDHKLDVLIDSLSKGKRTETLANVMKFVRTLRRAPSFDLLCIDEVEFFSIRKEVLKFYFDENSIIIINDIFDVLESEYIAEKLKK